MTKVFVHLHDKGKANWNNQIMYFESIPSENEYLSISANSQWYKVELVIHTPFSEEMDAEIYAVSVDHLKELKEKVSTNTSSINILK